MSLTFLSVCSGIEAASQAWEPLGWRATAFAEIEPFPSAVLAHHYPNTPNLGDITKHHEWSLRENIDLLVGGTPCQSFSVAGLRKGMDDPRGNLALVFLAIAAQFRPRWVLWENVPGVLSVDDGRAFGAFLGGLAQLGYGFAYRVLDAQFFGVPQRRRRVFVVGYFGDWRRAAAVLSERESLRGYPSARQEARKDLAPTLSARTKGGGGLGTDFDCDGGLICGTVTSKWAKGSGGPAGDECQNLVTLPAPVLPFDTTQITSKANRSAPKFGNSCHPLAAGAHAPAIAFSCKDHGGDAGHIAPTLRSMSHSESHANGGGQVAAAVGAAIRRLTPRECERLQGFPDDYTLIPLKVRKSGVINWAKDGPRYKALGNSKAVPVVRWLGRRIAAVEGLA